jgi:hypothetical protein
MSSETASKELEQEQQDGKGTVCPGCGAETRHAARFCSACGRSLEEQYRPAAGLRASYQLRRPAGGRGGGSKAAWAAPVTKKCSMSTVLPNINRNGASTTALAFTTYALVPFLGILFVPGAVLAGAVGLIYSYSAPHRGGRRASLASIFLGLVILCVQLLLWWIIIKVPGWSNPDAGGY